MLNTDKLELFIINVLKERILTEEHLTKLVAMIAEELQALRAESTGKLELVEKKLADVERRLSKLYRLVMGQKGFIRSFVKRIELDYPNAEIEYACPMTPPKKKEPLRREVLSIVQDGSPARTRTWDMVITTFPRYRGGRTIPSPWTPQARRL
ncbi:MAG: hypothetical protein HY211_04905 [Candidatus Omnitrophica bacterium]|nr:hypothetical protein [Candidatus Omnitrophota bacterium]